MFLGNVIFQVYSVNAYWFFVSNLTLSLPNYGRAHPKITHIFYLLLQLNDTTILLGAKGLINAIFTYKSVHLSSMPPCSFYQISSLVKCKQKKFNWFTIRKYVQTLPVPTHFYSPAGGLPHRRLLWIMCVCVYVCIYIYIYNIRALWILHYWFYMMLLMTHLY